MGYKNTLVYAVMKTVDAGEMVERKNRQGWQQKCDFPFVSSGQSKPTFKSKPTRDPLQTSTNIHIIVFLVDFFPPFTKH